VKSRDSTNMMYPYRDFGDNIQEEEDVITIIEEEELSLKEIQECVRKLVHRVAKLERHHAKF
jgi:hypothetical protein